MKTPQQPNNNNAKSHLPMPRPGITSFESLFNDSAEDPTKQTYVALIQPFKYNIANAANNTTPQVIKNKMTQLGAQHHLIISKIIAGEHSWLYLCLSCWVNDLVATNPEFDKFLLEGDLIDNSGYLVELPESAFNLINNAYAIPIILAITAMWQQTLYGTN